MPETSLLIANQKAEEPVIAPIKDDDGIEVREGDVIHFGYGIPPVGVAAPVINRDGRLIALTAGHKPAECPVDQLRKHVGNFWIERKV